MKTTFILIIAFLFISCEDRNKDIDLIKNSFRMLIKDSISEKEINKSYKFPFFNDRKIYNNSTELINWAKNNSADLKKYINPDSIEIISSYTFKTIEDKEFKNNERFKDLNRILTIHKGKCKILEVISDKERYLRKGSSILVLYDYESKKIFGFED